MKALTQRINQYYSQEQPEPLILQSLQNQQQQEPPDSNNQQQQNQQQNPSPSPSDPFEGLDLDLLPDDVRQAVTNARTNLQSLQNSNQTLTAQQRELQQQIEQRQQQQQQTPPRQQQQQEPPANLEADLVQYYIEQGLDAKQAAQVAKLNAGMLDRFGNRFAQGFQQHLSPIVGRVIEDNTADAFESIRANDNIGMLEIPEVAQATWDRLSKMAEAGQLIDHVVAQGIAKIFYVDHISKHGMPDTPPVGDNMPVITFPGVTPRQQQQMQSRANPNGGPQFTFPGSGHMTRASGASRNQQQQSIMYTPEERAAMAATVAGWPVKPKDFAPPPKVTRGAA